MIPELSSNQRRTINLISQDCAQNWTYFTRGKDDCHFTQAAISLKEIRDKLDTVIQLGVIDPMLAEKIYTGIAHLSNYEGRICFNIAESLIQNPLSLYYLDLNRKKWVYISEHSSLS